VASALVEAFILVAELLEEFGHRIVLVERTGPESRSRSRLRRIAATSGLSRNLTVAPAVVTQKPAKP
jgi:hypothetical protein